MAELAGKSAPNSRAQFRNISVSQIAQYRLPLAGLVSIAHRVSGALLFLVGLPFLLYLFQQSITSEVSFESYRATVSGVFPRLVLLALIWAYLHHFCAGIRYLLLDLHRGIELGPARRSSAVVLVVSLALTLTLGARLW